jgi:hypothetical protein
MWLSSVDVQAWIPKSGTPEHAEWLDQRMHEIGRFFQRDDPVHKTMRKLAAEFERRQIPFVIVGGMAVNAHHYVRTTGDVDFLVRPEGLTAIRELTTEGILQSIPGRARRFVEPETGVQIDVLVSGMFPGSGKPGPIPFPDPLAVREEKERLPYLNLKTLIELKLAARRHQDFADVVHLIRHNNLDESYMDQLHPSVHKDFIECLEEKRREDEHEARNG